MGSGSWRGAEGGGATGECHVILVPVRATGPCSSHTPSGPPLCWMGPLRTLLPRPCFLLVTSCLFLKNHLLQKAFLGSLSLLMQPSRTCFPSEQSPLEPGQARLDFSGAQ